MKLWCINDANGWVGELVHLNITKSSKIFLAMPWNIFGIFNFLCGKIQMIWQNILWHVMEYSTTSSKGLLTLNMGLANKVFECNFMWGLEDKRKFKNAFHNPWCNQYSKSLGVKQKLILKTAKMGGNYMVEEYLWNGQGTMLLYTKRKYARKHVMIVKKIIASFMNKKIAIDLIQTKLWCTITRVLRF